MGWVKPSIGSEALNDSMTCCVSSVLPLSTTTIFQPTGGVAARR
jgi:hypothetical protein